MAQSKLTNWSGVSDNKLGPQDLAAVHKAVINIRAKWTLFGTQLGLDQATIDSTEKKHHSDPAKCLHEVLHEWLKGNYRQDVHSRQSWRKVCEATSSPAGGDNTELAEKIAKIHPQQEELQGQEQLDTDKFYQPHTCGCGQCTIWSIITADCPNQKYETPPILRFNPAVTKHEKCSKVSELEEQTLELVDKFKEALMKTYQKLKEKGVSQQRLTKQIEYHYLQTNRKIIHNKSRLLLLGENITWFDCQLVDYLIDKFLKDNKEMTEVWAAYKVELKKYADKRIEDYEGINFALPAKEGYVPKYLAIDPMFSMKLSDLSTLRRNLCKILDIKSQDLFFYGVRTGSIILMFVLPQSVYKMLFPLSGDQLLDLIELGIISLHIEEFHVFPDSEEWSFVVNNRPGMEDVKRLTKHFNTERWEKFFRKLGLSHELIGAIQRQHVDHYSCFTEALSQWLRGNYNQYIYDAPNMRRLCAAVAGPGRDRQLALLLAERHLVLPGITKVVASLRALVDQFKFTVVNVRKQFEVYNNPLKLACYLDNLLEPEKFHEKSFRSIFTGLEKKGYINFSSLKVLQFAATSFHNKAAIKVLNSYQVKLDEFLSTTTLEEFELADHSLLQRRIQMRLHVGTEKEHFKLSLDEDQWCKKPLKDLKKMLEDVYEGESRHLVNFSLSRGSIVICVPVQKSVAPELRQRTIDRKYKLEEAGVVQVLFGITRLFSSTEEQDNRRDLTRQIQQSHHVSRLKNIISQWKTKLREYSGTIRHEGGAVTAAAAAAAVAKGIIGEAILGSLSFRILTELGIVGGAAIGPSLIDTENALKQSIKVKTLEVNEELERFYHFCHETAINHSVNLEQVYAISLECTRVSASSTEQINAIIRKYQNPAVANTIQGFGFHLSSHIFPNDLTRTSREDMTDIVRRLEQEHDQLIEYLKL